MKRRIRYRSPEELQRIEKSFDDALRTMDLDKIHWLARRYSLNLERDPKRLLIGLHMSRMKRATLPQEVRAESAAWLEARGHITRIDDETFIAPIDSVAEAL